MLYENPLLAKIVIITYCQITPPHTHSRTCLSLFPLVLHFSSSPLYIFSTSYIHWIIDKKKCKNLADYGSQSVLKH
jgi:hypothetical protein